MSALEYLMLAVLTLASGALAYYGREAWDLGWYSERAFAGLVGSANFVFCVFIWTVLIFA